MIEAIRECAKELEVTLHEEFHYGWHYRSIGAMAKRGGQRLWLRVHREEPDIDTYRIFQGLEEAQQLQDVHCTPLIESRLWSSPSAQWRADLMFFAPSPGCSSTPNATREIPVSDEWLLELKASLERLWVQPTDRVACRQELISRRIVERFGPGISSKVSDWGTVHADLHWGNLTAPELYIFDWEGWGKGPNGLDEATLFCFSLECPGLSQKIAATFEPVLKSPDGKISQLFMIAELLRMSELYNDHPNLVKPLSNLAKELLSPDAHA